jgi:hypothetical protein
MSYLPPAGNFVRTSNKVHTVYLSLKQLQSVCCNRVQCTVLTFNLQFIREPPSHNNKKSQTMSEEHQFALDIRNRWVDARNTPFVRHAKYFCDCPQRHRLKHVKPKNRTHYFAHIATGTKRKRDEVPCGSGGESMKHRLAKHKLRQCVNSLAFAIEKCTCCSREVVMHFFKCTVQLEMRSANGRWRYDCMVYDSEGGKLCALEIAHTHFSNDTKIQDTLKTEGLMIAEFLAEDVLAWDTTSPVHNQLTEYKSCLQCSWRVSRKAELQTEINLWNELEGLRSQYWEMRCRNDALNLVLKRVSRQAELQTEIDLWNELEDLISQYWEMRCRNDAFNLILKQCTSPIDKAISIIHHYIDLIQMHLGRPQWGVVEMEGLIAKQTPNGFLLCTKDTNVPAPYMFLLIIDGEWELDGGAKLWTKLCHIWETHRVCTDLVVGLRFDHVFNKLKDLQSGIFVEFKNCLFPILKNMERSHGVCARCGKKGHTSETCFRKFCTKCGRGGHARIDCYARTDLNGWPT